MPAHNQPTCILLGGAAAAEFALRLLPLAVVAATNLLGNFAMHIARHVSCMHACMGDGPQHTCACAKVYEVSFWLMKYGAGSPKRLLLRGNWPWAGRLDLGKLPREERERLTTIKTSSPLLSFYGHA